MTDDSFCPSDWMAIADRDWHRIDVLLADGDADGAAFFLQQAVEKYLKALLLKHGWALKKIHQLPYLLDEAVRYYPGMEVFRDNCERISGYYFAERYPATVASDLTCAEVAAQRDQVRVFIGQIKAAV